MLASSSGRAGTANSAGVLPPRLGNVRLPNRRPVCRPSSINFVCAQRASRPLSFIRDMGVIDPESALTGRRMTLTSITP